MQLEQQETFTIHGPQLEVLGEVESKLPAPAKKRSTASVVLVALVLVSVFGIGGAKLKGKYNDTAKLYTAIAFDAGGVASGPMTATFLLPLAQGACVAVGGNIVTDAFGVVAMVAMTPLITVQLMGLVAQLKTRKARSAQPLLDTAALLAELPDDAIIEL